MISLIAFLVLSSYPIPTTVAEPESDTLDLAAASTIPCFDDVRPSDLKAELALPGAIANWAGRVGPAEPYVVGVDPRTLQLVKVDLEGRELTVDLLGLIGSQRPRRPVGLALASGDHIVIWHESDSELLLLQPDLRHEATIQVSGLPSAGRVELLGREAPGRYAFVFTETVPKPRGTVPAVTYLRLGRYTVDQQDIATSEIGEGSDYVSVNGILVPVPLTESVGPALADDGVYWLDSRNRSLVRFEGAASHSVHFSGTTSLALTPELHQELLRTGRLGPVAEAVPYAMWPERVPLFDRMLPVGGGVVWLRLFATPGAEEVRWFRVTVRDGVPPSACSIRLAVELEPLQMNSSRVLAIWKEDSGATSVRHYVP